MLIGGQLQPGLTGQEVFSTHLPGEGAVVAGPDNLEEGQRRLAVEAQRRTEERLVPAAMDPFEHHRGARDVVPFLIRLQRLTVDGSATKIVEDRLHHADVQAEHGQLGQAVAVPQTDGVGPAGPLTVGGDHDHLPAVLLDSVDGRPSTPVQVLNSMAEDAVARGEIGVIGGHGTESKAQGRRRSRVDAARWYLRNVGRLDARDDRGQMTAFVVGTVLALWLFAGLVVDGGLALAGKARALDAAQEAARTGAQQLDVARLRSGGDVKLVTGKAAAAASAYVTSVGDSGTASVHGDTVTVRVTHRQRAQILQLIGVRTLTITATATAQAERVTP